MSLEYSSTTIRKFASWAENLPDNVDFIDYWYNLFLSQTKKRIECNLMDNINAFHWTRWREDFEEYVDMYTPINGNGFSANTRQWFGFAMQCLVYNLQMTSIQIADFYGKDIFCSVVDDWFKYHTYGIDQFAENFVERFGVPDYIEISKLHM